jgi:hypothetical protein
MKMKIYLRYCNDCGQGEGYEQAAAEICNSSSQGKNRSVVRCGVQETGPEEEMALTVDKSKKR